MTSSNSPSAHYLATAERMIELVTAAGDARETSVLACPGWTVRDVLAHVVGLAADVVAGDVDGYATGGWTAQQVEQRAHRSVDELVAEWRTVLPAFAAINDDLAGSDLPAIVNTSVGPVPKEGFVTGFAVDLVQHEYDVRVALAAPRPPHPVDAVVVKAMVATLRGMFAFLGLPAIEIRATDTDDVWPIGRGEPVAVLSAPIADLLRSLGGRRTLDQIRALDWSGDVSDEMVGAVVVPFFAAPAQPVE